MSYITDARDEVYTRINLKKSLAGFSNNSFTLQKAWNPGAYNVSPESLAADHPSGLLYVIGMTSDDAPNRSRTNLTQKELPVHIGLQHAVADLTDVSELDAYVQLVEELYAVCRKEVDQSTFQWLRTESLKDENELPFFFTAMREAAVFEAYFTAYYLLITE